MLTCSISRLPDGPQHTDEKLSKQWWAVRGSRAFSAGPIKNKIVWIFFYWLFSYHFHLCNVHKLPMLSLVEDDKKSIWPALQIPFFLKDVTSDCLWALLTESSANQILTFNDSPPPGTSYGPSATPSVRQLTAPLVRDFQGTKVKLNEKKMTAAVIGASTPGLVAHLLKTPFSRRSFADKRE